MKFVAGALALAAVAAAAPAPADAQTLPLVYGRINCNVETKSCSVNCGPNLQNVCTVVEAWDSAWYALEALAGFTVWCNDNGCTVYCPVDGTVLCAANEAVAAFDGAWVRGENIILDGVNKLLGNQDFLSSIGVPGLPVPGK
uniref:ARAD1C00770p n=1 Tax=Blastobotrys adeninivorans TaxID=409370 RepID=A0A060T4U8_BLAAD